jgi:hypothetical protein
MTEYADAKRALERLHRELMELNPSAARSLEEGLEETLTVHRLRVPAQLRRTLASTNVIESAFSIVETVCRNVKRWRAGDHIERWVGSGLLVAERQFRKVQGYRGDSIPVDCAGEHGFEEGCCRGSEGCVAYDGRESLTFNGLPGNVPYLDWKQKKSIPRMFGRDLRR